MTPEGNQSRSARVGSVQARGAAGAAAIVIGAVLVVALFDTPAPVRFNFTAEFPVYCATTAPSLSGSEREVGSPTATEEASSGPMGAPPLIFDLGNPTNESGSGLVCYQFPVNYAEKGLMVSQTAFEVKTSFCGSVSGILAIFFGSVDDRVISSEALATHTWENGSAPIYSGNDSLFVISDAPLTGDELVSEFSLGFEGGQSSQRIDNWTGEWEGCGFS